MNLRRSRTILLTLPVLLSSSLAFAQEKQENKDNAPCNCPDGAKKDEKKTTDATTTTKKKTTPSSSKKQKKGVGPGESTTVLGQKVENKDKDLDVSVGQTKTTSAERVPGTQDVVESRAEEVREIQGKRWSAAPLLGYSTAQLKFGVGARAGYTFETPVYIGGTFLYHFGNSTPASGVGGTQTDKSFYYPAVEGGYDIGIGPILVRPYGGVGVLFAHTSLTTNGVSSSATDKQLMIYPGISAQYILPRSPFYVGGDMRVTIPLEGEPSAFSLFATAGITM